MMKKKMQCQQLFNRIVHRELLSQNTNINVHAAFFRSTMNAYRETSSCSAPKLTKKHYINSVKVFLIFFLQKLILLFSMAALNLSSDCKHSF